MTYLGVGNLSAWYGQAQALWDVNLHIEEGEVVGVLGRNGAGKTTLLRSIAGLSPRISGRVTMAGEEISGLPTHKIASLGISLLRESGKLAASLTVSQNLALARRLARERGQEPHTLDEVIGWFPLLEPLVKRPAALLSGGQRQALSLAIAFASRPRMLLLDEPSAGLAPLVARDLFSTISLLAKSGITVLVVEQHPAWLSDLVSRCYHLEMGKVTAEGSLEDIVSSVHESEA